jgi:signal transduction histidine kinase
MMNNVLDAVQGAGFGLSITHDIVKAHGGVLKIESEAGKDSLPTIQMSSK